jgi:hypothetical protein
MTTLILVAVVGALGSLVFCGVTRTVAVCDNWGFLRQVVYALYRDRNADGELAAMIARNNQGVLGGNVVQRRARTNCSPRPTWYSGGR